MGNKTTRLKLACYTANISMAVTASISPLLFTTFHSRYGISFSLLGMLVLINFSVQLLIDLVFSFFSKRFNIPMTVRINPILCVLGLIIYALSPVIFSENIYIGLLIGTVIFSASGGLSEVLISPIIASIPAKDSESEMSKLHSVYAWGVVFVIIFSTLFLHIFGSEQWSLLIFILMLIPLTSAILFSTSDVPAMQGDEKTSKVGSLIRNKWLWICVACIFLGGAAECTMSQWCSSYLEQAFKIDKVWGDIFGTAAFAVMLGIGRTVYAKAGKNIRRVLFIGMCGATVCYLVAALSSIPMLGLIACGLTGLCTSMLWPGSLIVASDRFPNGGVFIYAMMAAGGDLGASIAPQIVGIITDKVIESGTSIPLFSALTADQAGMKLGILVGMLFPLIGILVTYYIQKSNKKQKASEATANGEQE